MKIVKLVGTQAEGTPGHMKHDSLLVHVAEGVICQVAVEVHVRLHTPEIVYIRQQRMVLEEAAEPAAHVVVRLPPPIKHPVVHLHIRQSTVDSMI